ncbi:Lrp/AsnC family transcriptional regulator [uncultured Shewanella sp.]|uniref:Lrp/AsnC family transcriptional regulator n=1 Tax=uncultured Shewanella sp. TaxID=173975 RepID=UPI00263333A7|nr:Lrp/AsnC family transcriptional regulator [uncultured Shewanella sp.]
MAKKTELDRYDLKILSELKQEGRMTKVKLADAVGLSDTPCSQRQKKLEDKGFIKSYHAQIDYDRLADINYFIVEFAFIDFFPTERTRFLNTILSMPEVIEIKAVLGEVDYFLTFAAKSVQHYQSLIEALQAKQFIFEYTSHAVSKTVKNEFDVKLLDLLSVLKTD